MSPNVFISKNIPKLEKYSQKYKKTKGIMLKYQEFIKKNFNYVGENFAHEVRSAHYKDKKISKGIYGTATKKDIRELKEEGIEADMIPWIKNNTN
tara:strand:- start:102 stop:386 length:285 start_codon:yes stop_codon:yes gene_type:complete